MLRSLLGRGLRGVPHRGVRNFTIRSNETNKCEVVLTKVVCTLGPATDTPELVRRCYGVQASGLEVRASPAPPEAPHAPMAPLTLRTHVIKL